MLPFPSSSVKKKKKLQKVTYCFKLETNTLALIKEVEKYIFFIKVVLLETDNKHNNADFCCRSGKNKRG